MDPGKEIGVDNVARRIVYQGLFVGEVSIRFFGGDKRRANISQIGAHGLGCQHRVAIGNGA